MSEVRPETPQMTADQPENHASTVRDALSRNIAASTFAQLGYMVTRFFIPPFVLARVTLEAYGLWSAAFILVAYIGISTMGLSGVYIKYIAEFSARREFHKANSLISTGLCVSVPACAAVFAGVWWFWPHVVDWLHIAPALRADAKEVVLLVVAVFLGSMSLSVFHDALVGVQRSSLVNVIWAVSYIVETILIFALVGAGRGIRGLAEAFLVRMLIDIALSFLVCLRTIKWLRISPFLCSREAMRTLLTFGGVVQLQSLLAVTLNSIERVLAGALVGIQATGLLEIAEKLPNMATSLSMSFLSSFVPAASYLHGGLSGTPEQRESIKKLYLKGARYVNMATAAICAILALMPGPLLAVWIGKYYEGAAYLMVIFSLSSQANLMTGPGTSILRGIGHPTEEFHYNIPNVVALLIGLPLSYLVLGKWTVLGIGTAVAASTVTAAFYFVWHANRLMKVPMA
ncbi:MAG: oligosaccharide flippase family protein, partial [Acidobacteriota bacterium]